MIEPEEKQKWRIHIEAILGEWKFKEHRTVKEITQAILNAMPEESEDENIWQKWERYGNIIAKRKINTAFRLAVIDLDDNIKRLLDWLDKGGEDKKKYCEICGRLLVGKDKACIKCDYR